MHSEVPGYRRNMPCCEVHHGLSLAAAIRISAPVTCCWLAGALLFAVGYLHYLLLQLKPLA